MKMSILDRVAFVALIVTIGIGSVLIAAYGIAGVVALGVINLFSNNE
jgi:hypothetical protein